MASISSVRPHRPMLERVRGHAPAIREIVARHGASDPRLFGSVARGEEHGASDVDFLVDHRPTLSLLGLVRMERELAALLDRDVDVVVDDEVPEKSMARILHDAIPL